MNEHLDLHRIGTSPGPLFNRDQNLIREIWSLDFFHRLSSVRVPNLTTQTLKSVIAYILLEHVLPLAVDLEFLWFLFLLSKSGG